ncbi:MAG: YqiA/YcfP family alpha/beta fold hydrolase [Sulfurimonas sp.]|jgi:hypothetical protein
MNTGIKLYRLHQKLNYQYCIVLLPFRLFYSLNDDSKSPKNIECSINKEIPDYITDILHAFAKGYNIYLGEYHLMNPLKSGIYFEKGAKFIDIMIENIPIQKGLVAAELVNNSALFGKEESMRGSAIKILLDRNLIKNSATPIHELFHVFQYNYCSFNNMWFMEGLARWGQNITHERKDIPEKLPSNSEELEAFLLRAHDAEYFWRRLIALSGIKEQFFIRTLLEHSTCQASKLEERFASIERYKPNSWTKEEKKSALNNKYIFSAILDTIREATPHANSELKIFLELLAKESASNNDAFNTPQIQRFFKVLQHYEKELIHEINGVLHCDFYSVETKTLEIKTLDCSKMSEDDLDSLSVVHHIKGDLLLSLPNIEALNGFNYLKSVNTIFIKEMKNLQEINGFNSLKALNSLEISANKNLTTINGFNALFKHTPTINRFIKIVKNPKLQSIEFLQGLKAVKSSFYLHQNGLIHLKGLEELKSVGASFSLSSNKLQDISALSKLESVNGMLAVAYNQLSSLQGLENLKRLKTTLWNGENRTLSIHANPKLTDISALSNILNEEDYYMIVLIDFPQQYIKKPDAKSNFHKNILELYNKEANVFVPTYKFISQKEHNYDFFGKTTHSPKLTHLFDFEMESDILVLSFSGFNGWLGGIFNSRYPFLIGKMKTHKIFILDKSNSWFHNGIENVTTNMDETIKFIQTIIQRENYSKILCVGASMGGYMALLIGKLINATNILAFSPQTCIDENNRKKFNDTRWSSELKNLNKDVKNTKYLDLQKLYEEPFKSSVNVEIHYSKNVPLDELHAKHLQNRQVKLIGYEDSDHYIAVYLHQKGALEGIILKNLGIDNPAKHKILFGDKWQGALSKCDWLEAHHKNFKNANEIIEYCKSNKIEILFANNFKSQLFILINERKLRNAGLKFIINNEHALKNFVNKQKFYDLMLQNNLSSYVPKYYVNLEEIQFPCVVKTKTGGAGRGVYLAYNKEEINTIDKDIILSEYLKSNVEYATTIFYHNGRLLKDITYSKTAQSDTYVLQQESKNAVQVQREETQFLELFIKIVEIFSGKEDYCACSINYKIENNIPKIFEINPRMGYTLAGFCGDFKEMMDIYVQELHND